MDNIENQIADRLLRMQLLELRKTKKLSQKEVAKLSGLSESCISNIENSELSSPTLRSLIRYANALGANLYIDNNIK